MTCKQCSTNYDGSFCPNCGAKAQEENSSLPIKGKSRKKIKKKKPFYLRWWFIVILIGLVIFAFSHKTEKIDLDEMVLGEMLPELPKDRGKIIINSSEKLDIDLKKISAKEYSSYATLCGEDFTIEAELDSDSFDAYNEDGYNIHLYYSSYSEEMSITIKAPIKMAKIDWPDSVAARQLPKPKSTIGKFSSEYSDSFFVYIGETSKEDFAGYVSACIEMGFNIDYSKGDGYYFADNSEGWNIHLRYVGNNIMSIDIDPPDEDNFEETTTETTTKESQAETTKPSKTETEKAPTINQSNTEESVKSVLYSTNDYETAKQGDIGIFSYKSRGGSYDIYWIIDFDSGYVYWFTDGNGDTTCDKVKIASGDLNDKVIITYHDGSYTWSYALHFKYVERPEILIMQDKNGFEYKYYTTDLDNALKIKDTRTIIEY